MSDDIKKEIDGVMRAFEEFKGANDQRLSEIEKKGHADPLLTEKVNKLNDAVGRLDDFNQKLTLSEKQAKAQQEHIDRLEAMLQRPGGGGGAGGEEERKAREYKAAFAVAMRKAAEDIGGDHRKALMEYKGLVAGNESLGGAYLLPPEMQLEIIKDLVELSPIRSIARVTGIGGPSLKLPKRTGQWTATRVPETGGRSETSGYTTGMVEIFAPDMYAQVPISEQMLEDSAFELEMEMRLEAGERFAALEGSESISGTGTGQMEGILTNADIVATNSGSAAAITADGLLGVYYDVKTAYAQRGVYILNRSTLKTARTLKTGDGQYLWMPGIAQGQPNTINGAPYVEFPDMPDQGANTYPVAFGDFQRGYRVVDRVLLSVLRDPFTVAGQVNYRFRKRTGGAVVLAAAIRKLKCSA